MLCNKVKANGFVLRQTSDSDFSHFDGTWEELESLVKENFEYYTGEIKIPGGSCVTVPMNPARFRGAEVLLSEGDNLVGTYKSRIEGEDPRKQIRVLRKDRPVPLVAMVILYQSSALKVDPTATPVLDPEDKGNWEIVSINAGLYKDPQIPLDTLLANQCGLSGGTPREFDSPEEELEAIKKSFLYWRDKAMVKLIK